jgi:hypothetical protein
VDRLKILLLPLIALLIPLGRAMPPVYQWRVRSRVYRWYGDLQNIDPRRFEDVSDHTAIAARLEALNALEDEVNRVRVPLSYTDEFYHLRGHIDMVRRDLQARAEARAPDPDGAEPA